MVTENNFKKKIGNESLHQDSNDNGVKKANFAISKNLVVKSTMFPHQDIHQYNWTSLAWKTHNQIDRILIGGDSRVYSMYDLSGELNVLLFTIWWLQKLGKDWQ
jgi:hypothetical protein